MEKKSVVFVSTRLLYPTVGGDKLKGNRLCEILQRHYNLSIVIFTDEKDYQPTLDYYAARNIECKVFTRPKIFFYLNMLKSLLNRLPLQINYYYFSAFHKKLLEYQDKNDMFIFFSFRSSEYARNINKVCINAKEDSNAINYHRSIKKVKSFIWNLVYRFERGRLFTYEKVILSRYALSISVNYLETRFWKKFGNIICIPNGTDNKFLATAIVPSEQAYKVTFLGKMDYQPNVDAVTWFCQEVLPYLKQKIEFIIIGGFPSKKVLQLEEKYANVKVTGFVDDPWEIISTSQAFVAPMQTGGGIQNKILEAMATGQVVMTTNYGADPVKYAKNNIHLLVLNNGKEFAKKLDELVTNRCAYNFIGNNARELIREHYTWEVYEKKFIKSIERYF